MTLLGWNVNGAWSGNWGLKISRCGVETALFRAEWKWMSKTPVSTPSAVHLGAAVARCMGLTSSLDDLPTMRELRDLRRLHGHARRRRRCPSLSTGPGWEGKSGACAKPPGNDVYMAFARPRDPVPIPPPIAVSRHGNESRARLGLPAAFGVLSVGTVSLVASLPLCGGVA